MTATRTTTGIAIALMAAAAALALASAPSASSPTSSRPLLTSGAARTVPPHVLDAGKLTWSAPRADALHVTSVGAGSFVSSATGTKRTRIVVESRRPELARASIVAAGGRVERSAGTLVQALVTPRQLATLSTRPGVDRVRAPYSHIATTVSGEEVGVALASAWHAKGFTGKGVKVAIVDGGFAGLAERQAAGDLPATAVVQDFCEGDVGAEGHGTAVAEIVHEMAPDAQLYLLCVGSEVDLAAAVAYAKGQGVTVVNQSMGWQGPYRDDGSGPIGAIVADARASGILWVNSAGNEAETHWAGTFQESNGLHMWAPGDYGNSFVWPNGWGICGFLKWDEWPAATSDFDLGLFLSGSNTLLAASAEYQGNGEPPFEALCARQTSGMDLTVFWAIAGYKVSTSPRLDLISWSAPLQYRTAEGSIATPASSPAALAVGALCWQSRTLEPFSSQGPTIDGRVKPDLVGHDSVSGATYGGFSSCPSAFAGTSASSPEVAGAAALVKQAYPAYTPDQTKAYLMRAARDLGAPGPDNVYGAGELQLPKPPDVVAPSAMALASSGRKGRVARLLARVSDDSGEVGLTGEVRKGRKVVARFGRTWIGSAAGEKTIALTWKVPAKATGAYQHCVRAIDRAGNSTPQSCARITLR